MSDLKNNIPGIKNIYRIKMNNLAKNVLAKASVGMTDIAPYQREEVEFFGVPSLSSYAKNENNGSAAEATLTFRSNKELSLHGYAYAVKAMNGKGFLLGTDTKEPVVQRDESTGLPDGTPAVYEYQVTMKDVIAPLQCDV